MRNADGTPRVALRLQPFATAEKVRDLVAEVYRNVRQRKPAIQGSMTLYLANRDTEYILFKPMKVSLPFSVPLRIRRNLRMYLPLPPAVCKRRTNNSASVCRGLQSSRQTWITFYLITRWGGALPLLALHFFVLICRKTPNQLPFSAWPLGLLNTKSWKQWEASENKLLDQ